MSNKTFRTFSIEGQTYQNLIGYMTYNDNIVCPAYTISNNKFVVSGIMTDDEEMLMKLKFNIKKINLRSLEIGTLTYMRNQDRK